MKLSKTLIASSVAAVMAAGVSAPSFAEAELGAAIGISNAYMWRGFELGSGTPVVWGDLNVSASGFFAGVWTSSGDTAGGTEYDIYLGYGGEAGDFSYGIQYVTYVYPTGQFKETDGTPGDFAEVILSLGYGPVSFNYHDNVGGDTGGYAFSEDYSYFNIALELGAFGIKVGVHDEADAEDATVTANSTHLDLSYAYNDNLSFSVSAIIASDADDVIFRDDAGVPTGVPYIENEPFFNVSYSIPLGE
jgi:uncharacterized protein (TIGR02001 family)